MRYRVQKLFKGFASVRDYVVEESIKSNEELEIWFGYSKMTVTLDELRRKFQLHDKKFRSIFNRRQTYQLLDFKFQADTIQSVTLQGGSND